MVCSKTQRERAGTSGRSRCRKKLRLREAPRKGRPADRTVTVNKKRMSPGRPGWWGALAWGGARKGSPGDSQGGGWGAIIAGLLSETRTVRCTGSCI